MLKYGKFWEVVVLDLVGQRYGRLTVIRLDEKNDTKRVKWLCKCDCGNEKIVQQTHLRSGATTSCGCYHKEKAKESNKTHNLTHTSLHNRWKAIKQRCFNPNNAGYKNYGGRGVKLCSEWLEFEAFYKWCIENGYKEEYQIDRIENDGNYEPNNVRFIPVKSNNRNRRTTAFVYVKDDKIALGDLEEIFEKYSIKIPSSRFKNKTVSLRVLYNNALKNFGKVDLKSILTQETYMKIPSRALEEILGRCRD